MTMFSRTVAEVRIRTIVENARELHRLAQKTGAGDKLVPMLKANAYGHGVVHLAKALAPLPELTAIGVATSVEALELREAKIRNPVWVFSESDPWSERLESLYLRHGLVPVFHHADDVLKALKSKRPIPFHIKVNTGLNRLGIEPEEYFSLLPLLKKHQKREDGWQGLCTHFADTDEPAGRLAQQQSKRFLDVVQMTGNLRPRHVHALSTQGIVHCQRLGLSGVCNVSRPGLGIYGYGAPVVKPSLVWKVQVIKTRKLKAGERVGYGGTFIAKGGETEAVIGSGYGDGIRRILSNRHIAGRKVLGRVSMDLTSIDGRGLKRGDWVTIFGASAKQSESLSAEAQTIVYEILTGISDRVPRVYKGTNRGRS